MSVEATIEDLNVNANKKLTPMIIKNLVDVINQEFNRQQTLYNSKNEIERTNVLDSYKKEVGFDKLKKKYEKHLAEKALADKRITDTQHEMWMLGLDKDGDKFNGSMFSLPYEERDNWRMYERAINKVEKLLSTVEANGPENVRNKIISRLWLASTAGEAMVILKEVLGNGIIPTLSKNDVKQITMEE